MKKKVLLHIAFTSCLENKTNDKKMSKASTVKDEASLEIARQ